MTRESVHRLVDDTLVVESDGIHARCICGWDSGGRFTSLTASALMQDHVENATATPRHPLKADAPW